MTGALATGEFRVPVEVLERLPELRATGAPVNDWRPVARIWARVDLVKDRETGEAAGDRGARATVAFTLTARWFEGWEEVLSPARRVEMEGRSYNLRSVVEAPGQGTERLLQLTVQAVVR